MVNNLSVRCSPRRKAIKEGDKRGGAYDKLAGFGVFSASRKAKILANENAWRDAVNKVGQPFFTAIGNGDLAR